jgi:hypothetical protein
MESRHITIIQIQAIIIKIVWFFYMQIVGLEYKVLYLNYNLIKLFSSSI